MKNIHKAYWVIMPGILVLLCCCNKIVNVPAPDTSLVGETVYNTDATAASAINGIYINMEGGVVGGGTEGISALVGLSADDFIIFPNPTDPLVQQTYSNSLTNQSYPAIWTDLYSRLYQANSAIEGISSSNGISVTMKQQLLGESLFLRAFCFFYLTNLYGDIPLVITTDSKANAELPRTKQTAVYRQIINDLANAQQLLSSNYLGPDGSISMKRVRPNKYTAAALLARTYLYNNVFDSAEIEASMVINSANYQLLADLDSVFLTNSTEAIWQLEVPDLGSNAPDASAFLLSYFGGPSIFVPYILSDSLVNQFDSGDLRKNHWVDSIIVNGSTYYYPNKYKLNYTGQPAVEYPTVMRLSEMYLIRAEARVELNNLNGAVSDLDMIRSRAGLSGTTATTQAEILSAIMQERRLELFTEYGHRWFDLKRTGAVDAIMTEVTPLKGGVWNNYDSLYPIPVGELKLDGNLTQNPGYQ